MQVLFFILFIFFSPFQSVSVLHEAIGICMVNCMICWQTKKRCEIITPANRNGLKHVFVWQRSSFNSCYKFYTFFSSSSVLCFGFWSVLCTHKTHTMMNIYTHINTIELKWSEPIWILCCYVYVCTAKEHDSCIAHSWAGIRYIYKKTTTNHRSNSCFSFTLSVPFK